MLFPEHFLAVRATVTPGREDDSDNTILIRFWKGIGIVRRNLFWLSDEQWKRIESRLPMRRAGGRSPHHQRHRAPAEERLSLVRLPARV
jgi:hypothetical protein